MPSVRVRSYRLPVGFVLLWLILLAASPPRCGNSTEPPLVPREDVVTSRAVGICRKDCIRFANDQLRAERHRHQDAILRCRNEESCEAEEAAFHDAVEREIEADLQACVESCH